VSFVFSNYRRLSKEEKKRLFPAIGTYKSIFDGKVPNNLNRHIVYLTVYIVLNFVVS